MVVNRILKISQSSHNKHLLQKKAHVKKIGVFNTIKARTFKTLQVNDGCLDDRKLKFSLCLKLLAGNVALQVLFYIAFFCRFVELYIETYVTRTDTETNKVKERTLPFTDMMAP